MKKVAVERKSIARRLGAMWYSKMKENTFGTMVQACVFPAGKIRVWAYVNIRDAGGMNFASFPRTIPQLYNGVFFMSAMRCMFSNAIPYVIVKSAKPTAGRAEMFGRLVFGTVLGVFCFNLADAQRQLTLRQEETGLMTLLKPANMLKRTRGYAAGLTRTVMYNAILTGDHSSYSYPRMLMSCMRMTFLTGPIDLLASLKREFHDISYWKIMTEKMKLSPKHPEFMSGLKVLVMMSFVRMMTLSFEVFAFKVAVRNFKKWKANRDLKRKEEDSM